MPQPRYISQNLGNFQDKYLQGSCVVGIFFAFYRTFTNDSETWFWNILLWFVEACFFSAISQFKLYTYLWLFICYKAKLKKKSFFWKNVFVFYKLYIIFRKKCFYREKKFYTEKIFYWKKLFSLRKIHMKM